MADTDRPRITDTGSTSPNPPTPNPRHSHDAACGHVTRRIQRLLHRTRQDKTGSRFHITSRTMDQRAQGTDHGLHETENREQIMPCRKADRRHMSKSYHTCKSQAPISGLNGHRPQTTKYGGPQNQRPQNQRPQTTDHRPQTTAVRHTPQDREPGNQGTRNSGTKPHQRQTANTKCKAVGRTNSETASGKGIVVVASRLHTDPRSGIERTPQDRTDRGWRTERTEKRTETTVAISHVLETPIRTKDAMVRMQVCVPIPWPGRYELPS